MIIFQKYTYIKDARYSEEFFRDNETCMHAWTAGAEYNHPHYSLRPFVLVPYR